MPSFIIENWLVPDRMRTDFQVYERIYWRLTCKYAVIARRIQ